MTLPDFLTQDPDGEIRLTGNRIGLYSVIRRYQQGQTAQQIVEELPSLLLSHVSQVLAFYLANRAALDAYVKEYAADLEKQAATLRQGPGVEELRQRWQAKGLGTPP